MNRLETYYKLLGKIYGESIVKKFTTKNENSSTLKMNDVANNQKAKKEYDRKDGEGCDRCIDKFRNEEKINFFKRNLEFPGWIKNLDFSENSSAKEIMIIGRDPPQLKEQINISFGLGYYPIKSDGKLDFDQLWKTYPEEEKRVKKIINDQEQKNKLWEYLNKLFSGKLDDIKPNIYITDLCKCYDHTEKKNMWKRCGDNYLVKEIELINPKLIIFQGWDSYTYLRDFLIENNIIASEKENLENVEQYYTKHEEYSKTRLYYNPFYGKLALKGNQIHFFVILHQAYYRGLNESKKSIYINRHLKFIKKKILEEVLH